MAGVSYWDGSTDTSWTTAANWTAGSGPGSTPPAAGDEVIIDGRANATNAPTTDVAVGDTGGVDFDLLHIKDTFTGNVGAAGSPLHTSAQKIIIEGSGTYYIEVSEDATGKDQTIPLVIVNNPDATVYLSSNENDASWCCEFTEIIVSAGTVYIGNNGSSNVDTAVGTLRIMPRDNRASNATVTIYVDCERYKATTYKMSIYMANGTCTTDSAADTIEIYKGTFNYGTDLAASPETGLDITTLRMHGGTFNWRPDDSGDDAYIGDVWLFGGKFDASGTTNADRAKVLGNGAGNDIHMFDPAELDISNGRGNITIAGSSQLWNHGGTLKVDSYSQITWSYDQP